MCKETRDISEARGTVGFEERSMQREGWFSDLS